MSPEEFRRIRKAARMTQAQIAERLGVSRVTIVNWEAGKFNIPDTVLDILTDKGIAPEPDTRPVTPKTHPHLYRPHHVLKNVVCRTHEHPHWFVYCGPLRYHMTPEQIAHCESLVTLIEHVESVKWTPERAVAFIMQFDKPNVRTRMSRAIAQRIAHDTGFAVDVPVDPYLVAQQEHFRDPSATLESFYAAYPRFKPVQEQATGEIDPELKNDLDNAFNFKPQEGWGP
jgi:Helix-turn-helix